MITKHHILKNLTVKGTLKNNYKKFFNKTTEELHCILNDINETPKCICGKNRSFRKFTYGYNELLENL
jgi:hypothetical protein